MFEKRHKFGVADKSQRTASDGRVFHSKRERKRYEDLLFLVQQGHIRELELQPKFEWTTTYSANGKSYSRKNFYKADFRYFDVQQRVTVTEDVKGHRTAEYVRKARIVKELFDVTIVEV